MPSWPYNGGRLGATRHWDCQLPGQLVVSIFSLRLRMPERATQEGVVAVEAAAL